MSDVMSNWGAAATRLRKIQNDPGYDFIASRRLSAHGRKSVPDFVLDGSYIEDESTEGDNYSAYPSEDIRLLSKLAHLEARRHVVDDNELILGERESSSRLLLRVFVGGFITFAIGVLTITLGILLDLFVLRALGSLLAAIGACAVAGALIQGQRKTKQKA